MSDEKAVSATTGPPVAGRLEFPVTVCPTCGRLGPLVEVCVLSRCPRELITVRDVAELRAVAGKARNDGRN